MKKTLSKDQWFAVCKELKPKLRQAEYDKMWDEFQAYKDGYKRGMREAREAMQ
jgi:hypothetical protein